MGADVADLNSVAKENGKAESVDLDSLVREYESGRIYLESDGELPKQKNDFLYDAEKQKNESADMEYATQPNERLWAAIAHASPFLSLVLGLATFGLGVPFMLLIPLGIYLAFQHKSEFVTQNALEALKSQVIGTFGWIALFIALPILGFVLSIVLVLTIIGILLIPVLWILIAAGLLGALFMPIGMYVFAAIGTWKSYQGELYRYPFQGWFARQRNTRRWQQWRQFQQQWR
jgi:uncharacterized Tic20 family protein